MQQNSIYSSSSGPASNGPTSNVAGHPHSPTNDVKSMHKKAGANYNAPPTGGFYEFEDGGHYIGCWEDGKAHGFGICTGPKGQGEYAGSFDKGFEVSGVYRWPTGSKYSGQWQNGLRNGLGVEKKGNWVYRGEWNKGHKGRYGVRESTCSCAKYEGTWAQNLQDGYGIETYADSGKYTGQWVAGMRNGLGVRTSVPYGMASIVGAPQPRRASLASLSEDQTGTGNFGASDHTIRGGASAADSVSAGGGASPGIESGGGGLTKTMSSSASATGSIPENFGVRGGFVLNESYVPTEDNISSMSSTFKKLSLSRSTLLEGLRIRVKRKRDGSTNSLRSDSTTYSGGGAHGGGGGDTLSVVTANGTIDMLFEEVPNDCTEIYMGEWQRDKRTGCGISERTDGLRYEGYWLNNKRHGFGCLFLKDGRKVEGKWRSNKLVSPIDRKKGARSILPHASAKRAEKVERAVIDAKHAAELAKKKAEITLSRVNTAQLKAEQANQCADLAQQDADYARVRAKEFAELSHRKPPPDEAYSRRRMSSTPSSRHSVKKMPSDASNWMDERESQKDYLSVPSEGTASFKSSSDHDLRGGGGGRRDSSGAVHGSSSPWSGSKETLEVIGDKVKSKFNRLSRSFRIRRKGGHSGSGSFRGDQEPPDEQLDDYPTGSMSSLKSARERSGSMPCSAVASSGTGPGEHHGASKTWEGPSWEIPSNFLPSPIMEVTSPDFANNTPFGYGQDQTRGHPMGEGGGTYPSSGAENSLINRHHSQLANSAPSTIAPAGGGATGGIGSSVSSAAAAASMSFAQRFGLSSANYFGAGGQDFDVGGSRGYGGSGVAAGGGFDPPHGRSSVSAMASGSDSASTPGSSSTNPSSSNHYSAFQEWNWLQSGEMAVFVLILNLGFTALFAHLLSS